MKNIKATVTIQLKDGILDPEAEAIQRAMRDTGADTVAALSLSKVLRFLIRSSDQHEARQKIDLMCREFLVNPVMQTYFVELSED